MRLLYGGITNFNYYDPYCLGSSRRGPPNKKGAGSISVVEKIRRELIASGRYLTDRVVGRGTREKMALVELFGPLVPDGNYAPRGKPLLGICCTRTGTAAAAGFLTVA